MHLKVGNVMIVGNIRHVGGEISMNAVGVEMEVTL